MTPPMDGLGTALETTLGTCPCCQRYTRLSGGACKRRSCRQEIKARERYHDPGLLGRIKELEEAVHLVSGEGDSS